MSNFMKVKKENRREKSNRKIKKLGIACLEDLPLLEDSSEVILKDIDTICKRAIACLLSIQLACDITEGNNFSESKKLLSELLESYDVKDYLIEKEKRIFEGTYSKQDVVDVYWTYEAYWFLV